MKNYVDTQGFPTEEIEAPAFTEIFGLIKGTLSLKVDAIYNLWQIPYFKCILHISTCVL